MSELTSNAASSTVALSSVQDTTAIPQTNANTKVVPMELAPNLNPNSNPTITSSAYVNEEPPKEQQQSSSVQEDTRIPQSNGIAKEEPSELAASPNPTIISSANITEEPSKEQQQSSSFLAPSPTDPTAPRTIKIVMSRSLSLKDINNTLGDIYALNELTQNNNGKESGMRFQLEWNLFCYKNETYQSLLNTHSTKEWKEKYATDLYYLEGTQKIVFWYNYLNPHNRPDDIDYFWMSDGDIQLRNMNWFCFWKIALQLQPSIFSPAVMQSQIPEREKKKIYAGSTHPKDCHNKSLHPTVNDFDKLMAVDALVVEVQLPILTKKAWETVFDTFEKYVPTWSTHKSDWALDLTWCKIVDHYLHGVNNTDIDRLKGRPKTSWGKARKQCSVAEKVKHFIDNNDHNEYYYDPISNRNLTHGCMVIHATPVLHLDTRTVGGLNKLYGKGFADKYRFQQGVPQFMYNRHESRTNIYRAYMSNDKDLYQCQECKHETCLGFHAPL